MRALLLLLCAVVTGCAAHPPVKITPAQGYEIPTLLNAPTVDGHPLTSVVVTACNAIVVIYLTMPDGKLIRIDPTSKMDWGSALTAASTATRSEQVAIPCAEQDKPV